MEGYSGGFGYLGHGSFPGTAGEGQDEVGSVNQHQVNLPYSQQLNIPADQDMLQNFPHLRHTVGHEFQSPVSPHTTQSGSIPRFPLSFPQLGSFPGFQNPELLQQFLEMQQMTSNRQQNMGNYSNIMSNYLHPAHSFLGQSIPNSLGNVHLPQDPKSPIDLHYSPAPSPARSSPNFPSYSQPVSVFNQASLIDTHTTSVSQNQFPVSTPSLNSTSSLIPNAYPYPLKEEPLQIPNIHAAFLGARSVNQEHTGVKLPEIITESTHQPQNSLKQNTEEFNSVIPRFPNEIVPKEFNNLKNDTAALNNLKNDTAALSETKSNKISRNVTSIVSESDKKDNIQESDGNKKPETNMRMMHNNVKFLCLGKLSKSYRLDVKRRSQVLSEVVDCEERLFSDIILNLPVKREHIEQMQKQNVSEGDNKPEDLGNVLKPKVSEKSKKDNVSAEYLRPMKLEKDAQEKDAIITESEVTDMMSHIFKTEKEIINQDDETTDNENDMDDSETKLELDYDADESHLENNISFDTLGIQDNWYSAAMKKYAELNGEASPEVMTAKKGGRSDPENPFAITSPSFSESAARALVVTTNSDNATLVMVSIMSIGSRKKLIPKLASSAAAKGGIVSIVNPVETSDSESKGTQTEECSTTSVKLKSNKDGKTEVKDEQDESAIDRLDISIKIDDDQFLSHGEHKRWQCKLCPKSYTTKHNLVAHILDHCCIKPHLCLVCGKYFKQLSHLNTHMLTHDNVKPHVCDICHKGFTQISHLKRHQMVHCESKPYICDICNRGFVYPSELRIHKDKHVPGKNKCVDCGMEFPNVKELREHMTLHEHGNKVDLTCQQCWRTFQFPSQLKDHMLTHSGARPYMCTECGMDFMKEHHLKAHQFTHTGLRPYSCPYCFRSFNQKANMVRHMLIHNAQRAFKCETCGKTFTQPQTLKAHMVVHADKKPFSCKFCGKQFGRLHNLQGHLHIHNNTKPYCCSICGSSFTLKGNLNRHKKVKHGLSESMENMEEDAVNFLGNLSDRMQEFDSSYDEQDLSRDDSSVSAADSKSQKKGRKSIPHKRFVRLSENDSVEVVENGQEVENHSDDDERVNELTYSEEERENDERLNQEGEKSKYFGNFENGNIAQKTSSDLDYRIQPSENNQQTVTDKFKDTEDSAKSVDETDQITVKNDYDEDTDTETESSEIPENVIPGKRPVRKRKVKCLAEDFIGEHFGDEDVGGWGPQPTKVRKKKGAKLDSLIATKFKNV